MTHFLKSYHLFCLFAISTQLFAQSHQPPVVAHHAMVVSEHVLASQVGRDVLRQGGNAIDAAVAMGYALAVVNPCCGNIGGGGFMTIHLANGKNIFFNFRERAPLKATAKMFTLVSEEERIKGYLAVAVPGTVMGLDTALQKYGTRSRETVMAPAIRLAESGFTVTPYLARQLAPFTPSFQAQTNVANIFLNQHQPLQPGQRLQQPQLANTLRLIAKHGSQAFYQGDIAHDIVVASQQHGGILTLADFAHYHIEESTPITCHYHDLTIISAPPPSAGGTTLCEMLHILENFPLQKMSYQASTNKRLIIEAMRYGFIDRNTKLGDPDFVTNPISTLLDPAYANSISKKIRDYSIVKPQSTSIPRKELTDTTHYSVVDRYGNAVAVTYSLNGFFGAQVIAGHTGFFLNDEMDDFASAPGQSNKFELVQSDANAIAPGKRPLSSMTPTIILRHGKVSMVLGSPGGPRIISALLLVILNKYDYGMRAQQAVDAPRFHYQENPDVVDMEYGAFTHATQKKLRAYGYHLTLQHAWGGVEAIYYDPTTRRWFGANDKRRPDGRALNAD